MSSTSSPGNGSHAVGSDGTAGTGRRRRRWLLPLIIALALVVLLLLLLSQCSTSSTAGDGSSPSDSPSSASSTASPSTSTSAASPAASGSSAASSAGASAGAGGAGGGAAGAAGAGSLTTAGGAAVLPLAEAGNADGGLASVSGQQVTATAVTVQSVPADEGFWVGTSESDRAWVQLSGDGESSFSVQPGQAVSFTATVVPNVPDFATSAGVDEAEGAAQLTAQGQHLQADRASLIQAG